VAKYIVIMKGFGEGCDYTIGCNMSYEVMESDKSLADFANEMAGTVTDPSEYSDPGVKKLIVVPYDAAIIPDLGPFRKQHQDAREAEKAREQEVKDRKKLEELKKKYGG